MKWLRLYDDVLDDPKAQQLTPVLFKNWINLLCLASKSEPRGTLPAINDVAFRLRVTPQKARTILKELAGVGLVDAEGDTFHMHNWNERQPNSDNVAARVRKHRESVASNNSVTLQKHEGNALDKDKETDTEEELPQPPKGESDTDEFFETFYGAYPRHEGKEAARKAWRKLKPSASLIETILADIDRRLTGGYWIKGSPFIPMPGPYLNGKRWNDELPSATPPAPSKPDRKANPVAWAIAEKARLEAGEWETAYERQLYTVPPTGEINLARELARLTGIITAGEVAA